MNIASHMQRAGQAHSECPAVAIGTNTVMSYGELANRVSRLAYSLSHDFNLTKGDRIALILENCPEYLEILYACWHAGMTAVPVNAKLHKTEFAYILDNSGAKLCFISSKHSADTGSLDNDELTGVIDVHGFDYGNMLTSEPLAMCECQSDDHAWLFYTSGTTGKPKGAMLSHRNLLAMSLCYFADVDQESPWLSILHPAPMSHGSGLYALAHVMQAGCHVIPESGGFDAGEIYKLIEAWPGNVFFAAPTMVKRLLDHPGDTDTANLKTIIYGGGPMYVEDCMQGLQRFGPKLAQLYGQGESPMTITALNSCIHADNAHPRWRERLSSVGVPQSAVEVRVADDQDQPLPMGETGEILVRGETVMSGYWQNPQATAETLRNGWLHTGDFGSFDEEGFLTLKDRCKDLIISGGANIYPREVEEVLLKHPQVSEASVIGRTDREWGEVVVAYVVASQSGDIDAASLDEFCLQHIARFKRPKHYRTIENLPKNNYGKVLKTKLREIEHGS